MSTLRKFGTKSDRYAYKRLMVALKWYQFQGRIIRFLTLTGVNQRNGYRKNFDAIRRILRKRFGTFEYFAVRTDEGQHGVLHILYVGKSFSWRELSQIWKKISGAWLLSIRRVREFKGIGFEMSRQQRVVRYSQSRRWFRDEVQSRLFSS